MCSVGMAGISYSSVFYFDCDCVFGYYRMCGCWAVECGSEWVEQKVIPFGQVLQVDVVQNELTYWALLVVPFLTDLMPFLGIVCNVTYLKPLFFAAFLLVYEYFKVMYFQSWSAQLASQSTWTRRVEHEFRRMSNLDEENSYHQSAASNVVEQEYVTTEL